MTNWRELEKMIGNVKTILFSRVLSRRAKVAVFESYILQYTGYTRFFNNINFRAIIIFKLMPVR